MNRPFRNKVVIECNLKDYTLLELLDSWNYKKYDKSKHEYKRCITKEFYPNHLKVKTIAGYNYFTPEIEMKYSENKISIEIWMNIITVIILLVVIPILLFVVSFLSETSLLMKIFFPFTVFVVFFLILWFSSKGEIPYLYNDIDEILNKKKYTKNNNVKTIKKKDGNLMPK